ncbi:MAG: acyl-CoA thioesterase [Oscillospiraceae bacterium]|jgi:acyl-CoA thioester hydrolase|nr:acyl-CoA thioesterase [Oscillospiraceae bacterium]
MIRPYKRKTQYYETDQMGIIHHANALHWFEEARVDFMEQIGFGYRQATAAGLDFALLSAQCGYKSMAKFGETVVIELKITELTPARMTVSYTVSDEETGTLRMTGSTEHCYFSSVLNKPVSLKKTLPELYKLFEETMA